MLLMTQEEIGDQERYDVWRNMRQYGGSFVRLLGELLIHADPENTQRIKNAWPEYWEKYKNIGGES